MEIPSEFTIAEARWNTPKIAQTFNQPDAPTKMTRSKSFEIEARARKLSFNENVTVHQYEIESSSSSLCSEDIDRDMENDVTINVTNENEILCPESPEQPDSPLICLETIFEDRHSDSLFQSDSSESEPENEILRGRKAKKAFEVKFGSIPAIT